MKEMIQKVREDKGGFTLAELLVVVAIIAVLVAIAIPVFTSSLDRSNANTDAANIRSGFASASVQVLQENPPKETIYTLQSDGTVSTTGTAYSTKGSSTNCDTDTNIGGKVVGTDISWTAGQGITYTYTPSDKAGVDGTWKIAAA